MINLMIELATPVLQVKSDGKGYELRRVGKHRVCLTIGNVSLAFDGRNGFDGRFGCDRETIELSEYHDDPVRLDNVSCPGGDSVAETLLFALAADLGYTVSTGTVMIDLIKSGVRKSLIGKPLRALHVGWELSITNGNTVRAGYIAEYMLEAFPDSADWPHIPVNSIEIPDRFIAVCEDWAGNEYCKLRAISSTGGLTLGTIRPFGAPSDEQWYHHIWSDLSSDVGAALRGARDEKCFPGGCEDIPVLAVFDAWVDGIVSQLEMGYNTEDE